MRLMSAACAIEQLGASGRRSRIANPSVTVIHKVCPCQPPLQGGQEAHNDQYTSCTPGAAGSAFYYHAFLLLLYYIIDIAIEAKV